jgi:hypothetical protein
MWRIYHTNFRRKPAGPVSGSESDRGAAAEVPNRPLADDKVCGERPGLSRHIGGFTETSIISLGSIKSPGRAGDDPQGRPRMAYVSDLWPSPGPEPRADPWHAGAD